MFYCHDVRHGTRVAVKVVRAVERYSESARIEADLLRDIAKRDAAGTSLNVRMLDDFEFRGHVCMVFEPLGCSLYDFVKDHDYRPMPVADIRVIGRQLLHAIAFLHSMRLAHTDLKLENVLLVRSDPDPRVPVGYCSPRYKDVRGALPLLTRPSPIALPPHHPRLATAPPSLQSLTLAAPPTRTSTTRAS